MARSSSPLTTIVYRSIAAEGLSSLDLDELLSESRVRNRAATITGMLISENGRFLQALEGPDDEVHDLMTRIGSDPRHRDVRILQDAPLDSRRFPDWAMAQGHVDEVDGTPVADYLGAMLAARHELPAAVPRAERIRTWFRG